MIYIRRPGDVADWLAGDVGKAAVNDWRLDKDHKEESRPLTDHSTFADYADRQVFTLCSCTPPLATTFYNNFLWFSRRSTCPAKLFPFHSLTLRCFPLLFPSDPRSTISCLHHLLFLVFVSVCVFFFYSRST